MKSKAKQQINVFSSFTSKYYAFTKLSKEIDDMFDFILTEGDVDTALSALHDLDEMFRDWECINAAMMSDLAELLVDGTDRRIKLQKVRRKLAKKAT